MTFDYVCGLVGELDGSFLNIIFFSVFIYIAKLSGFSNPDWRFVLPGVVLNESCEVYREFWVWRSWVLVCMAEGCLVCYVFYFETGHAKPYGLDRDMFCFTIFVIRLCRDTLTSAGAYAYFFL